MSKDEAERLILALDGLAAHLETVRNLVASSVTIPVVEVEGVCGHATTRDVTTHGGEARMCLACGEVL